MKLSTNTGMAVRLRSHPCEYESQMKKPTPFPSFLLLAVSLTLLPALAGAAPKGAVELNPSALFQPARYWCGSVDGAWISGSMLSGGFFYPDSAKRKKLAKMARRADGRQKQILRKKIKALKSRIAKHAPVCGAGPNGTPIAIYVSPEGSDSASGSLKAPIATLEQARSIIRDIKAAGPMTRLITVFLRGGTYRLSETFLLEAQDC